MSQDTRDQKLQGLSAAEVEERRARGLVNANADVKTKTIPQIVAEHTFTLFNGVNAVLALLVFLTGQYRNMLFMVIVLANLFGTGGGTSSSVSSRRSAQSSRSTV